MIRVATYKDIPMVCGLMKMLHDESPYREYPLPIDRKFKPLLMSLINSGNGLVLVDDPVTGFFMGSIEPLCQIYSVKFATNVFFYPCANADKMVLAFVEWAKNNNALIRVSANTAKESDAYLMSGLAHEGHTFKMEVPNGVL